MPGGRWLDSQRTVDVLGQDVRLPGPTLRGGRLGIEDDDDSVQQGPKLGRVDGGQISFLLDFIEAFARFGRLLEYQLDPFVGQTAEQLRLGACGKHSQDCCGIGAKAAHLGPSSW
jgi:hypothetical protein